MSQRTLVWRALAQAGLLDSEDPQVREFVALVRDRRDLCWSDLVAEFRSRYYDAFEKLIPALEASDDPFIRNMLIKHADPGRPRERQMLKELATTTDFERNALAAQRLGELHIKEIDSVLRRRVPEAEAAAGESPAGTAPQGESPGKGAEPAPVRKRGVR